MSGNVSGGGIAAGLVLAALAGAPADAHTGDPEDSDSQGESWQTEREPNRALEKLPKDGRFREVRGIGEVRKTDRVGLYEVKSEHGTYTVHGYDKADRSKRDANVRPGTSAQGREKYIVFYDGPAYTDGNPGTYYYAGMADSPFSSSPYSSNTAMTTPTVAAVYHDSIFQDGTQYHFGWWDNYVTVHELWHTMGTVSPNAPNHYGANYAHCKDGVDVMCYEVPGGSGYSETKCPLTGGTEPPLDCGYDDYFNTWTEPGEAFLYPSGWHWNTGTRQNVFLDWVAGGRG